MTPEHSFGGSHLDRHVFDFETVETPIVADTAAPAADVPTDEAPAETAAAAVEPEADTAAGGWSPADPQFREAVATEAEALITGRFGPLMELAQMIEQGGIPDDSPDDGRLELPELDPFDPASVQAYHDARDQKLLAAFDQRLQALAQPLMARETQERVAHYSELVSDIVADEFARNGELTDAGKELIDPLGAVFLPQFESRYGKGSSRAAEATVAKVAEIVRGIEKAAADKALEAHINRNAQLAGVHVEPGGAGGAAVESAPAAYRPGEIAKRFGQRATAIREGG